MEAKTGAALRRAAPLLGGVSGGRLMMEMGTLLGHGAAAASLALMWRYRILDLVLPQHAAYLKRRRVPRWVGFPTFASRMHCLAGSGAVSILCLKETGTA